VAIDQHFKQRNRFADMQRLVDRHPQLLGIGIDESTALIVRGPMAEVRGRGAAHFFVPPRPETAEQGYLSLASGARFHLEKRLLADE